MKTAFDSNREARIGRSPFDAVTASRDHDAVDLLRTARADGRFVDEVAICRLNLRQRGAAVQHCVEAPEALGIEGATGH